VTRASLPVLSNPISIATGDFNRDGKLDLAVAAFFNGKVAVLLGRGDGTFEPATYYTVGANETTGSIVAASLRREGLLDLIVTNDLSNEVQVLFGKGDGTFRLAQSATVGKEPFAVVVGAFSRGGIADLAVANLASNNVSVLTGNGEGTFQAGHTYSAGDGPSGIAVGDLNLDGKLDLAVCNDVSGQVSVYQGNGDGTFQAAMSFATGGHPTSIAVGDLDHKGRADIVTAGPTGIVVLRNTTSR